MTDVIDFLERMGQDAQLRHASQDEVEFVLSSAEIDPALRVAILARSEQGLQALLGQEPFCCYINPGKEDDGDGDKDDKGKDGKDGKDGKGDKDKVKKKPSKGPKE